MRIVICSGGYAEGGGNFGVVTSFEYQLHPVKNVVAGPMFWPVEALEETMRWYREWLSQAPVDTYAFYVTAEVFAGDPFPKAIHGKKVCGLLWCYLGSEKESEAAIQWARDYWQALHPYSPGASYINFMWKRVWSVFRLPMGITINACARLRPSMIRKTFSM